MSSELSSEAAAYNELLGIAKRTPRAMPEIIVRFGTVGEQLAATRVGRGGKVQMRKWIPASQRWTKWMKVWGGEVIRIARQHDRSHFGPSYGVAWERD